MVHFFMWRSSWVRRLKKCRLYSQKYSFLQSLYSGGKGEKYQVSIWCRPSSMVSMFLTCRAE
jgi:hypothetical protein